MFIRILAVICIFLVSVGCEKTRKDMAPVPEGEFIMGGAEGHDDEKPQRKVFTKSFLIDSFEVTKERYRDFVKDAKYKEPKDWTIYGFNEEEKEHPVAFVSYEDAQKYCEWAGRRLLTEEEWEKAARGADGRVYPWGGEFKKEFANTSLSGIVGAVKVGSYENGKSPYGVYDMAGNVWEWTSSDYDEKTKVVRGGSWGLTHRFARSFFRVGYPPNTTINNLGFRCAKDG